jgi:hypothetical protein
MSAAKLVVQPKVESRVDYSALEQQRSEALQAQLREQMRSIDVTRRHSMPGIVLRLVADSRYKDATYALQTYIQAKQEMYPKLGRRCENHFKHAKELVNAVRAKRNFPGLSQLSMSKQKEILDHSIGHFQELKLTLRSIELMIRDEAVKDIRSTAWVIKSIVISVGIITVLAFISDFQGSVGKPFWSVFVESTNQLFNFLIKLIPFI